MAENKKASGVDYSAPTMPSGDDVSPEQAKKVIEDYISSTAFQSAGQLPGVDSLRAAIAAIGAKSVKAPNLTTANRSLDEADSIAAQFAQQQASAGPVAAAQRLLMANQLGSVAQAGGLAKLGAAQNQATGLAGQVAQQESNAAAGQAQGITGQTAASRLQQYVMQGMAHHADLQRLIGTTGMSNAVNNAQTQGAQTINNAGQMAQLGADAQDITNQGLAFQNNMQYVQAGLGAVGAGLSVAGRMGSGGPATFATPNGPMTGSQINAANGYGQYQDPALAKNAFGTTASSVYGGAGDYNTNWAPTDALV